LVSGLVQGVGYRHTAYRQALRLGLAGWVRNLADGRVEGVAQGDRALVEQWIAWCRQGPAIGRVDRVDVEWEAASAALDGFEIRF
jgi:acylphosphatase